MPQFAESPRHDAHQAENTSVRFRKPRSSAGIAEVEIAEVSESELITSLLTGTESHYWSVRRETDDSWTAQAVVSLKTVIELTGFYNRNAAEIALCSALIKREESVAA